jgi:hypothetical protein
MRVELLYFDGCPNHEAVLLDLREALAAAGVDSQVELVRIQDVDEAARRRFLGSPTVRIDGEDVDPMAAERRDFGLKCRLFATADGLRGTPPEAWIRGAIERARDRTA